MSNAFSYYTAESMQDKKVSDLVTNADFLKDSITFLKSNRKGYTDEDISKMSGDDVVSEVLEHFRYQVSNEVTMAKDVYYMKDDSVDMSEKQSFGRLMFAFDNSKGEGLFDRGGEAFFDYVQGGGSAPSTYGSILAGFASAGTGAAAIQGTKAASLLALRELGKKAIKRSLMAGMADGVVAAGQEYGNQKIRESIAPEVGVDYEGSKGAVALSGALGFGMGAAGYGIPAYTQHQGAKKLADTIDMGRKASEDRIKASAAIARKRAEDALKDSKKSANMEGATKRVLQSIDPSLVREGNLVKKYLLSEGMPDGLIGGLSLETVQRLSAASYDLAERLGVNLSDPNIRITEILADNIGKNKDSFFQVAESYGLTPRQLSATYAAEVSQAAKILGTQSGLSKRARKSDLANLSKKVDELFEAGMAPAKAEDLAVIAKATRDNRNIIWRNFKDVENARRLFMTSQPATTMRNNIFSVAMTGIDIIDQLNASVLKTVSGKSGMPEFKGSVSNLKYLTKDNYVADALVTMLQGQSPEKFQKVFFDAAIVEANVVKDSKLTKLGAAANTLNTLSDFVVKRAIITGNIDRTLRQRKDLHKSIGNSVMDMLEKGTADQLPEDILDAAIDESLAFTFQRRFGGKDASQLNKGVGNLVRFIHNTGLTVVIPFPRYLASQAKFVSDYTGLTLLRRPLLDGVKPTTQETAKFMTGAMTFGGLYSISKDKIHRGLEWFEAEGEDGRVYDAQAALGPASAQVYVADYYARIMEGLPVKPLSEASKDLTKILGGTEFRPGVGLADNIIRAAESGNWEPLTNQVGDYFSSYTYPAAVLKDFYGQFDPRSSYLPETRDATVSVVEFMGMDFTMSTIQRITRHLPDFNSDKMSEGLEKGLGIKIAPETLAKYLEFANTSTRTYYQTQYTKDADANNMRQDAIRYDVFGNGPIRILDPLVKQLTGFVGRPPKNALQREMTRLQVDPFRIYNPYMEKNQVLELFTQQKLQGNLAAKASLFMMSPRYAESNDQEKQARLREFLKAEVRVARADAEDTLQRMSQLPEATQDYESFMRGELKAMGRQERKFADLGWAEIRGEYGYEGLSFDEALDVVDADRVFTPEEKGIYKTNLIDLYIGLKDYQKYIRDTQ
tara:strand:+ start:2120 stop:5506 length:3387 start_codon:yes stop_codon:yes gene_type:complete